MFNQLEESSAHLAEFGTNMLILPFSTGVSLMMLCVFFWFVMSPTCCFLNLMAHRQLPTFFDIPLVESNKCTLAVEH